MKIDFSKNLKDFTNGKDIQEEGAPISLSTISVRALLMHDERTVKESGDKKLKDYQLAVKIHDAKEVELTAEEAARIKERIAMFFGTMVVGQAWPLLDGKEG